MEYLLTRDGIAVPKIGFGTYKIKGALGVNALLSAYEVGYRWFDTAYNYENEGTVGKAIKQSGMSRESWLITSKLPGRYQTHDLALEAIQESLYRAGLDYYDFYLIHWPNPLEDHYVEAWQTLIQARQWGLIRSIGVCNFNEEHLQRLIRETGVTPSLNQIELHPQFNQKEMIRVNASLGILTQAWSPIGRSLVQDFQQVPELDELAKKYHKSVIQIILRWHLQNGVIPIPKSQNKQRQIENIEVFDFELSSHDCALIDALNRANGRLKDQDPAAYQEF